MESISGPSSEYICHNRFVAMGLVVFVFFLNQQFFFLLYFEYFQQI